MTGEPEDATLPPTAPATPAPTRLAARSPIEAFLWIFVTRLIALLTATRAPTGPTAPTGTSPTDAGPGDAPRRAGRAEAADPVRARRVAGSRRTGAPEPGPDADPAAAAAAGSGDTTRALAVTTAVALVGGATAFAVGRRRGAR